MDYELLQKILDLVVPAVISVAVPILVLLARTATVRLELWLEAKLGLARLTTIKSLVREAVLAAEQAGLTAKAKGALIEKKDYALSVAQIALDEQGIKIDLALLDNLIEAAVYDELNMFKEDMKGVSG